MITEWAVVAGTSSADREREEGDSSCGVITARVSFDEDDSNCLFMLGLSAHKL